MLRYRPNILRMNSNPTGDIVIRAENLSKQYTIGAARFRHDTLKEQLAHSFMNLVGRNGRLRSGNETFWALRDVSFQVKRGEIVGIIGRNGAGKSTLLKILSRISEPTSGSAELRGRVGSLLEVGTGFDRELTGRENVYLNGAILGMKKAEIDRKFDEIVDFSGVEKFIDTPVKHYSSGMYVRLAFAVAAHLEPEILLVDEVLTVGDAGFQKKCLGKMGDVARQGRTVLFVSHDLGNITKVCPTGILLNYGKVEMIGEMPSLVERYLWEGAAPLEGFADLTLRGDRSGSGDAIFRSIELLNGSDRCTTFPFGSPLTLKFAVDVRRSLGSGPLTVGIATSGGILVYHLSNWNEGCEWSADCGIYQFSVTIPQLHLYPGTYTVALWVGDQATNRVDYLMNAISFHVVQTPDSATPLTLSHGTGLVYQTSQWSYERISPDRMRACATRVFSGNHWRLD